MKKVGIIGQRGMVGSVLMERMRAENDFSNIEAYFYSTSQVGQEPPKESAGDALLDAYSVDELKGMEVILTCQGGDYTKKMHGELRNSGWKGIWIDAASTLRMDPNACLVLDPINGQGIRDALNKGVLDFVGANCTVSLLLMGIGGLMKSGLVDWVSTMTYQAASGAGARNMKELLNQMGYLAKHSDFENTSAHILEIDRNVNSSFRNSDFPDELFGAALAGGIIPFIDSELENGQSREEWKAMVEANKILGTDINPDMKNIPIDGTCVRVGAMRCHAQGLTIKLNQEVSEDTIKECILSSNDWVKWVDNNKAETVKGLNSAYISGSLNIPVGRVRPMNLGPEYWNMFTVGDQLLWGAAEPLRRMLNILSE
ncbi:MAG: aspartate-semialdehyde dehydrogenase [Oligoflexia bacterium]|nr:aspartate-semialdehyde dehydrogenase [Oligoflexia bacterium]